MTNSFKVQYELQIKLFCRDLQKYLERTLLLNMMPVIITPSRKMARLFMWLKEKGYIFIPNKTVVISEFAITFSMEELVKVYGERLNVLITDDVINSGRTIDDIAACVRAYTNKNPTVLPLLIGESKIILHYASLVYNGEKATKRFLEYFTTRNVENFMSMGMPIDMEYPIVNIKILNEHQIKKTGFEEKLARLFENCTIYSTKHIITYKGVYEEIVYYTVLLDQDKDKQYSDNDFSKIRFFISDNYITIEFYSPKTVDEYILNTPKQFRNDSLRKMWEIVHGTEESASNSNLRQMEVVLLNKIKSEIVFTNYLYSLVILKQYINSLFKVFELRKEDKSSIDLDLFCLGLLVGHKKAGMIYPYMFDFIFSENKADTEQYNLLYSLDDEEIPAQYEGIYYQNTIIRLFNSNNIEEGISSIFNVQRLLSNTKMSFGESFSSLENKLRVCVSFKEMKNDIHKCVDFMIDEAAIAPSYMRIKRERHFYWKRMFSFGDGRHVLDQFSKCVLYVFDKYMELTGKTIVEKNEISSIITMVFNNKVMTPYIFNLEGRKWVCHKVSHSKMYIENICRLNILDYLNSQNMLMPVDVDGMECYKCLSSEASKKARAEVPFDEEQLKLTDNLIYFLWKYSGKNIQMIRPMVMPTSDLIFKEAFRQYISDLIIEFEKAKINNSCLKDLANKLHPMVNNLFAFIQSYNMYMVKGVPAFDNNDNDDMFLLWKNAFKTKEDILSENHLVDDIKKATILLLELLIMLHLFFFEDKNDAEKFVKSMIDLNENNSLNLDEFSQMITKELYINYSPIQVIDIFINLTRQFY